jgi:hypothetical protein
MAAKGDSGSCSLSLRASGDMGSLSSCSRKVYVATRDPDVRYSVTPALCHVPYLYVCNSLQDRCRQNILLNCDVHLLLPYLRHMQYAISKPGPLGMRNAIVHQTVHLLLTYTTLHNASITHTDRHTADTYFAMYSSVTSTMSTCSGERYAVVCITMPRSLAAATRLITCHAAWAEQDSMPGRYFRQAAARCSMTRG